MWFSPSALPAGNFFVLMYSSRGSRGNAPCGCRAEPAESLPQGTRRSRFRTLKSKPNGLRYLLPPGNYRRRCTCPPPISKPIGLRFPAARRLYAIGETEPVKQNGSFAPNRVKGQCPLRVQGGARGILAVRHLALGASESSISKPNGLRYLLPPGNHRRQAYLHSNKQVARLALSCRQAVIRYRRN